jgi:hypothetical protein
MDKPSHTIIKALGRENIAARIGVSDFSIRHARASGKFPASWYAPLREMCAEAGVACSLDAFNWKSPLVAPPEEAVK